MDKKVYLVKAFWYWQKFFLLMICPLAMVFAYHLFRQLRRKRKHYRALGGIALIAFYFFILVASFVNDIQPESLTLKQELKQTKP